MRLIDADALVAELQKKPIHDGHFIHTRDVSDAIFYAPTISPDEVRGVGEWEIDEQEVGGIFGGRQIVKIPCCSNCGTHNELRQCKGSNFTLIPQAQALLLKNNGDGFSLRMPPSV